MKTNKIKCEGYFGEKIKLRDGYKIIIKLRDGSYNLPAKFGHFCDHTISLI